MGFVVNLNKPYQITSHRAVSKVKKILKAKKAGHAGTLDPIAEGVLLICIDEATKIARFLTGLEKEYIATIRLGQKTDTYDSEGKVIESHDPSAVGISEVEAVVVQFTGLIEQVPPMYSAVKSQGTPLYKLARKGKVIERKPRTVNIIGLEILEFRNPMLKVKVICSKGTYIRSLAHDIGDQLGVGAHLDRLVRTRVGDFTIEDSVSMEPEEIMNGLIAMDASLGEMKEMRLKDESAVKIRNGVPILFADENILNFESIIVCDETEYFRIKDESGELFAIGKVRDSYVRTERVFLTKPKEVF
jgi:tRNA pseudouridine55 synthase